MRIILLFSAFLITVLPSAAQITFAKGYIINLKGDTLRGDIKVPKKEHDNFDKVTFKDPAGPQKSYDSDKIKGFGYRDLEYVVMPLDGEKVFFKVLEKGPIMLYKQMFPGFRMNKMSWETEYYFLDPQDKKLVLLKEGRFKRQLTQLMQDKPEFIAAYDEKDGFDAVRIQEVIHKYNAAKTAGAQ